MEARHRALWQEQSSDEPVKEVRQLELWHLIKGPRPPRQIANTLLLLSYVTSGQLFCSKTSLRRLRSQRKRMKVWPTLCADAIFFSCCLLHSMLTNEELLSQRLGGQALTRKSKNTSVNSK